MSTVSFESVLRCVAVVIPIVSVAGPARSETINTTPQPVQSRITEPADSLVLLVDAAVDRTTRRYLETSQHTPWQIMHGLLALRTDYVIKSGGQPVRAIDWISNGAKWQGEHWFEATPYGGKAHPYSVTYWFEGHVNQFLAIISMCNLPLDHQFHVKDGKVVTMADMVRHAQLCTTEKEETTWTLWFLDNYLDQDAQWTTHDGEAWSMERLVRINTRAQVITAPCGGTHQLFALALARNAYLKKYGRLTGAWLEADQKLQSYIAAAKAGQNPDGSFSSAMFKGWGLSNDFNERIKTSGHMLEWLMAALPERRLGEEWVRRGVEAVARDLVNNANQPADCGPLYHALHALILYRERIAPQPTPSSQPSTELAGVKLDAQPRGNAADKPAATTGVRPEPKSDIKLPDVHAPLHRPLTTSPTAADSEADKSPEPQTIEDHLFPPPPPTREPLIESEPEIETAPVGSDIDEARPLNARSQEEEQLELPPLPPRMSSTDTAAQAAGRTN